MNRKEIKAKAKEFAFKNKWNIWKVILGYGVASLVGGLIVGLIVGLTGQPTDGNLNQFLSSVVTIILGPMEIGCTAYVMKLIKGETMTVKEALTSKYSIFGLFFSVTIIVGIFTCLWTLLLIIPGIIYAFKMAMCGLF